MRFAAPPVGQHGERAAGRSGAACAASASAPSGMAADAVVVPPRDQQALLGPSAAAERDAQQRDHLGQARPQQVGDAGRAEHGGPRRVVQQVRRLR